MAEKCTICKTRRSKRYCPGLRENLCPQCCGQEREESIACPFDCEYLVQGRNHEQLRVLSAAEIPHPEIIVKEEFLRDHEPLVLVAAAAVAEGVGRLEGLIDYDAREALESLIKAYKILSLLHSRHCCKCASRNSGNGSTSTRDMKAFAIHTSLGCCCSFSVWNCR